MAEEVVPPNQQLPPVPPQPDPRVTKLEQDLAEQRRMTQQLQQQMPKPTPPQRTNMEELNAQFYKEPTTTAYAIAQQAAREVIQQHGQNGQETLVQVAKQQARGREPELWDKHEPEINEIVRTTVDPQFHSNVSVWNFALDKVIGSHISDIRQALRDTQPGSPAIKVSDGGPAAPGGVAAQPLKNQGPALSDDEKEMAKMLDISPEQYSRGKVDYEGQNKKGPSSWDDHVTFSSKDTRRKARAERNAKRIATSKAA